MTMEDRMIRNIDSGRQREALAQRNQERSSLMSPAIKRVAELSRKSAVNPDDFVGLYGAKVEADKDRVKEVMGRIEEQNRQKRRLNPEIYEKQREAHELATALEFLICEGISKHGWLGPNATAVKTAEFDDLFSGVDIVAELNKAGESKSHLGLAVDVSFAGDLERKIARIRKEIDEGKLPKVKYFASDKPGADGFEVPRVIAGLDGQATLGLAQLWEAKKEQHFAVHPVQRTLLYEMKMQLAKFRDYARKVGKTAIAEIYAQALDQIEEVIKQKADRGELTAATKTIQRLEATLEEVFSRPKIESSGRAMR